MSVLERPAGKLPGFGRPQPLHVAKLGGNGVHDRPTSVQVQLDDILAGERMRGGKCKDERLVDHVSVAAQNPAKRRFPRLRLCAAGKP